MALIKYGGGVAAMSGKQGGAVHARNRAGAYIRNWAFPTTTPTASQTAQRAAFGAQSSGWKLITEDQRKAWNDWAAGLISLNGLGESYVPTGRQMYMSCNRNLQLVGAATISDPPLGSVPPTIDDAQFLNVIEAANVWVRFRVEGGPSDAQMKVIAMGAPTQLTGKTNLTTMYRIFGVYPQDGIMDMMNEYEALFPGQATVDGIQKVKLRNIDSFTGLSSPFLIIEATIIN